MGLLLLWGVRLLLLRAMGLLLLWGVRLLLLTRRVLL